MSVSNTTQWSLLLYALGAGLAVWFLAKTIKNNPGNFSADNAQKSLRTFGLLALGLIGLIALCIMLLKSSTTHVR